MLEAVCAGEHTTISLLEGCKVGCHMGRVGLWKRAGSEQLVLSIALWVYMPIEPVTRRNIRYKALAEVGFI